MAFIFREKRRRPIPEGAEILRRKGGKVAKWTTSHGRTLTAVVDGESIIIEGHVYYARWRDAGGIVRTESTGCRGAEAAEQWLSRKVSEVERIQSGVVSQAEADTAAKSAGLIDDTLAAFTNDMKSRRRVPEHIKATKSFIKRCADDCGWRRLADMDGIQAGAWLRGQLDAGKSARTYNRGLVALSSFGRWCVKQRLILSNPFNTLSRMNEKADRRYERRPLTTPEVTAIIEAARIRPVMEATKGNKRCKGATLSNDERARLEWKGWNRALCYRLMSVSGLRYGEARGLRLSDIHLEGDTPHITIQAAREKARRGAQIPLHGAVIDELALFIKAREKSFVSDSSASIVSFPGMVKDAPLFDDLPTKITRQFKGDCKTAKVKTDMAGRVVDVHSLRYYFGTELARAGVPLHVVQKLMRHSTPTLTSAVYIHSKLSDLGAAVDLLPDTGRREQQAAEAVGNAETDTTLNTTLPDGKTIQNGALLGNIEALKQEDTGAGQTCGNPNKYRGFAAKNEWQPVGDSNPCDKTENLGDTFSNGNNNSILQDEKSDTTPNTTLATHQNAHFDGIKAALSELSKDELIALLADMLADKADSGEPSITGDNGNE